MSERISLLEVLHDYGTPLVKLDVKASEEECLKLREKLMTINAGGGTTQGYLEVACTFYVDVHDIDRYLSGELPNLAEIYTFPEDVKTYEEK
ncbi:MAG: hypothetical protein AB9917_18175 [Negativicutes bacterium]